MIKQVPGRRGGSAAGAPPQTARLTMSVEEVRAVKQVLAGLLEELGVSLAFGPAGAEMTVVIDPRAVLVCAVYVRALRTAPRVAKGAEVTADQLATVQLRARALGVLVRVLDVLRTELVGSRLVLSAGQGVLWDRAVQDLEGDLKGGAMSEDERLGLKSAAGEVLGQVEREQGQQKQRRDELKAARAAAQARVAAAVQRRRRLQGLLRLQDEEPVDAEVMDELWRIYEEQVRVPGEEQRKATR